MAAARLTRAEVLHIAELARLALTEAEVDRFTTDLESILTYASEIQQVDTRQTAPMSHALGPDEAAAAIGAPGSTARADTPEPCLDRDAALANAPDPAAGLFRVPKVRG